MMQKQQVPGILDGASIVGLAMISSLSGCSGDDPTPKDSGTKDQTSSDTGTQDTGTTDGGGSDGGGSDGGSADCGSIPTLHPAEAGAIFCGYLPDGGPSFSCTTGTQCCLGGKLNNVFLDQKCEAFGSVC